ncbi:MAG: hypothetical protein E6Q98_18705 [Rhodospirillaceae bacterium]|nr:MAG: hypothetical protein E6Q98_18705 [Rhodospirillaceae bacterium]
MRNSKQHLCQLLPVLALLGCGACSSGKAISTPAPAIEYKLVEPPIDRGLLSCSDGPDWSVADLAWDLDLLALTYGYQAAWLDCKTKLEAIRALDTRQVAERR